LLVSEQHAKGFAPLPYVKEELEVVSRLIPPGSLVEPNTEGSGHGGLETTVDKVLGLLSRATVVHFACHGFQDPQHPLRSGFQLKDGRMTVARIIQQHLPAAFFAFLGACETAKGDRSQPDQVLHLASAMLFAGYRSVVGTMW
jgi:CHAT domain-containing protein